MVNIMLVCAQGMSTSLLVKKMEESAAAAQVEATIWAVGNGQIQENYQKADIILLGPQIRFRKKSIREQINNHCPVIDIEMVDYGTMNGESVLNKALKELNKYKMEERPSNFRRLLACILDWYICSVLIAIPHNIMSTKMTDIYKASIIIAYSAIAITFVYYALIPYITKGQTIGKKLLKLRVVKMNGQQINLKNIFFREIIGVFLIEGSIFAGSNYFRELIQLYTNSNLLVPLSIASSVITIMSIGYSQFNKERIMFHDLIGGTKVIKSN